MDEPTLLLRPFPQRDEGPQGYLLRLAETNFLMLRDLVQFDIRFNVTSLRAHQLLPDSVLDPGLFAHVERIAALVDGGGRNWNRQQSRFCPHCLNEASVWRAPWELMFYDACPLHGNWLVDQCSSCNQPLRWSRERLLRCPCGADLRAERTSPAPLAVQRLSAELAFPLIRWPVHAEFALPLLQGMNIPEMQRLIRFFGGYLDPAAGAKPLKLHRAGSMSVSWPVTSLAAETLRDWPQAFHATLSHLQSTNTGEKRDLRGFLHHAYHYLYQGLSGKVYDPVRAAFEAWLAEHWQGGLAKRNRRLTSELLAKVQWIPGSVACDQLGISKVRLQGLIREGLIEGQTFISTTHRKFTMVRRDQLDRIREKLGGEMTMTAAMEALGIGKVRMRLILRLLFHSARRVNGDVNMPWCVPRTEVEALLAIGSDLPAVGIPDEHQVSLAHVLRFWNWSADEIVALVEAVKDGSISLSARYEGARGISGWIFEISQLRAWLLGLNNGRSNWMSIPEMARVLGIKQEVAYWLARSCFIKTEKLGRGKGFGSRIHRQEVERFRQHYVFCREIAAKMGRSSRKVNQLLQARGIYPLQGDGLEPIQMLVYAHCGELQRFMNEIDRPQEDFRLEVV